MSTQNPHEDAARAKKVQAISTALDAALRDMKLDPFTQLAADYVSELNETGWTSAATIAGCNPASLRTRTEVIALYLARVAVAKRLAVRRMDGMDAVRNRARGLQWVP